MRDEWELLPSELSLGPRIGIGSFGEVHRGTWRHTDVAVKRLLEQDLSPQVVEVQPGTLLIIQKNLSKRKKDRRKKKPLRSSWPLNSVSRLFSCWVLTWLTISAGFPARGGHYEAHEASQRGEPPAPSLTPAVMARA